MPRKQRSKKMFEDKSDPDCCKAKGGMTMPIKEDGEVEGKAYMWQMADKDSSLVLAVYHDGELRAYIEPLLREGD